ELLRRQPARQQGHPGQPGRVLVHGDAGERQGGRRLRDGLRRDRLHRGPAPVRHPDAHRARRRRPDRPDRRDGPQERQDYPERYAEGLRVALARHCARPGGQGALQPGPARLPPRLTGGGAGRERPGAGCWVPSRSCSSAMIWRASACSETSVASGVCSARSLRRAYWSNSLALPCRIFSIRSSTLSGVSRRCTWTVRTWPIRWARATACVSKVGFTCGSQRITTEAAWRLRPTPPAWICASRTAWPGRAVNSSTTSWRRAGGTLPDSGPCTPGPSASATTASTSRKEENTTTFRPLASASSTTSTSRPSLADGTGAA